MLFQQGAGPRARTIWLPALLLVGFALSPASARADYVYSFAGNGTTNGNVSHNSVTDAATGGQYTVTVSDAGSVKGTNYVSFTFRDNGPAQSTIANVYFADGSILGQPSIAATGDVNYVLNSQPAKLPSAPKTFVTTEEFDSSAQSPEPSNGVDWMPNDPDNGIDSVTLTFALLSGKTYQNVINELSNTKGPQGTPQLQIGMHVINFGDGQSESFINNPSGAVLPEPSTMTLALGGGAMLGLAGFRRLRRRRAADLA